MKTYENGAFGVKSAKVKDGYEWVVIHDGKRLQVGSAGSIDEGCEKADAFIASLSAPVVEMPANVKTQTTTWPSVEPVPSTGDIVGTDGVHEFTDPGELEAAAEDGEPEEDAEISSRKHIGDDFPHAELLKQAGLNTYGKVRNATDEEILAIEHIGPAGLKKIREAQ